MLTIVSSANHDHYPCWRNLLRSIKQHEPDAQLRLFDIGLHPEDIDSLGKDGYAIESLNFSHYPAHCQLHPRLHAYRNMPMRCGHYAWKPVLVQKAILNGGNVIWLDAGNFVHAPLSRIKHQLDHIGIYTPVSKGTIRQWTHPTTIEHVDKTADIERSNRNAAIIGFNADMPDIEALVKRWVLFALEPETICPPGSSIMNHRYDQSLLTLLAYQWMVSSGKALEDRLLDVSIHNDGRTYEECMALGPKHNHRFE